MYKINGSIFTGKEKLADAKVELLTENSSAESDMGGSFELSSETLGVDTLKVSKPGYLTRYYPIQPQRYQYLLGSLFGNRK